MGTEAAVTEYFAHLDVAGFNSHEQTIYVWRRTATGMIEMVYFSEGGVLGAEAVLPTEGTKTEGKPFAQFSTALWPYMDGILKALHDLYRRTHNLDEISTADAVRAEVLKEALDVERQRVNRVLGTITTTKGTQ